jgi:replication initiator protein A
MLLMFSEGQKMIDNGARELQLFELDNGPLIHVEVNMEELPIFLFKSRDRVEESLQARNTIITEDGQRLDQYVKVTGGREFGLPGPADRDAYVAVMRHVHRNGGMPADGWVSFSIYGLLRMMGKNPRAGKNHDNVRDSLDRIADCIIYAENAFYNNEDQDFESHRFNPWSVHFKSKKRKKGPSSERHTLKFHEILVRSYNANYLKRLDSDFYFSLHNALAKTLYGLIDVRRKGKLRWSVELMQLRQLIPLPDIYYQPSKIKERLDAAHRELLRRGFLTRVDHEERRGVHLVHYGISGRFVRERTVASYNLSPRDRSVAEGLIEAGVWPETARKLVRDHGPDHCLTYLDALPFQQGVENPGAWLRRYIDNDWPVPLPGTQGSAASRPSTPDLGAAPPPSLLERQVRTRLDVGEFDKIIRDFENLPYDVYKTYVGTSTPIVDATGNKFYLSLNGDLFLYLGGTGEEHRHYLCTLSRGSTG